MTKDAMKAKTDTKLLDALAQAVRHKRTRTEIAEQRVSFIYSAMDKESGVTKERIREALAE